MAQSCICGPQKLTYSFKYGCQDQDNGMQMVNWREQLVCQSCGLNNRMRTIVHVLTEQLWLPKDARIYITEQTTQLYRKLKESVFFKLIGSEFLGDECALGSNLHGLRMKI